MTTRPPLDLAELSERLDGDMPLVQEILELFDGECEAMLASVEAAAADGDPARLERAAHTLKGALLNIAALPAAEIAEVLEAKGRAGEVAGAGGLAQALREGVESVRRQLQAVSV